MPLDEHLLVAFLVTAGVAMVTPGPDMLFVLGAGMRGGPRAGLLATAGVATSEAVHVFLAAAGLAAVLAAAPFAFTAIRVAGAAYLIYLGVQLIRRRGDGLPDAAADSSASGRHVYLSGLLTNLLNPKMVVFTLAFLPQFVNPGLGQLWVQFAVLGAILIALEFFVDGTVAVLAGKAGAWLRRSDRARRRIEATTGALYVGLGVRLAAER